MTPADAASRPSGGQDQLRIDSWDLCREFVEQLMADAAASAARDHPDQPAAEIDWVQIWQAGEGEPSEERAIGRIIRVASETANRIAQGAVLPSASAPADRAEGRAAATASALSASGHPLKEPDSPVPAQPATDNAKSAAENAVPAETVTVTEGSVAVAAMAMADERVPEVTSPQSVATVATPVTEPAPMVDTTTVVGPVVALIETEEASRQPGVEEEIAQVDGPAAAQPPDSAATVAAKRRRHTAWATVFTWTANIGAIILLFVVWQFWGTSIAQHHAQNQLKSQFDAAVRAHHQPKATGKGPALISAGADIASPPDGTVIAHLQIPRIGVDEYVVSGSNESDLSKGPGHYIGTAMPGQAGNVAIAGHRTTNGAPFNRLGDIVPGDRIFLTSLSGQRLTYVVSGTPKAVSPRDVSVLNYFGDNRVTLTTCTPKFSSAQRLIVVGELKQPAGARPPQKAISYNVANSTTASWNWALLPAVGVEVCLLLLLGLSYRRFDRWFERTGKWIVLVPLWVGGLYLLFDTLTKFLPASL